jgi:hypothetical protein
MKISRWLLLGVSQNDHKPDWTIHRHRQHWIQDTERSEKKTKHTKQKSNVSHRYWNFTVAITNCQQFPNIRLTNGNASFFFNVYVVFPLSSTMLSPGHDAVYWQFRFLCCSVYITSTRISVERSNNWTW